jgi:hypothetical protein
MYGRGIKIWRELEEGIHDSSSLMLLGVLASRINANWANCVHLLLFDALHDANKAQQPQLKTIQTQLLMVVYRQSPIPTERLSLF